MACVRARFKVPWASCFRRRHHSFVRFPEVACDNLPFGILKRVLRAARTGKSYFRNCFLPCMVFNATAHRCAVDSLLQTGWGPACSPAGRALSRSTPQILPAVWISKDRPSIVPEPSSPLPGWIAPSLRRSAATPPARSDLVVSHHLAGLLLVGPARAVAAAHDPGVHHRFTNSASAFDPRDACLPFEAFPPPIAVSPDVGIHVVTSVLLRICAGRITPPARPSPCSAAAALVRFFRCR